MSEWPDARPCDATCGGFRGYHLTAMSNEDILSPRPARGGKTSRATFRGPEARGPIIDQEGREIPAESLGPQFQGFRFDFGTIQMPICSAISAASSGWRGSMRWPGFWTSPSSC